MSLRKPESGNFRSRLYEFFAIFQRVVMPSGCGKRRSPHKAVIGIVRILLQKKVKIMNFFCVFHLLSKGRCVVEPGASERRIDIESVCECSFRSSKLADSHVHSPEHLNRHQVRRAGIEIFAQNGLGFMRLVGFDGVLTCSSVLRSRFEEANCFAYASAAPGMSPV